MSSAVQFGGHGTVDVGQTVDGGRGTWDLLLASPGFESPASF